MGNKLYVGGLPWATTDEELKAAFSASGSVASAQVVRDRMTGKSKGFGFVEMATEADAQKAQAEMHGKEFGGRTLTVDFARPKQA